MYCGRKRIYLSGKFKGISILAVDDCVYGNSQISRWYLILDRRTSEKNYNCRTHVTVKLSFVGVRWEIEMLNVRYFNWKTDKIFVAVSFLSNPPRSLRVRTRTAANKWHALLKPLAPSDCLSRILKCTDLIGCATFHGPSIKSKSNYKRSKNWRAY